MPTIKTAISIEESLFRDVNRLAQQLKIPRSQVFTRAAEEFVKRHHKAQLLQQINSVYNDQTNQEEQEFLRHARRKHRKVVGDQW